MELKINGRITKLEDGEITVSNPYPTHNSVPFEFTFHGDARRYKIGQRVVIALDIEGIDEPARK